MDLLLGGIQQAFQLIFSGDALTWHALLVSLSCTVIAVFLAALIAVPYGAWLGLYRPNARGEILLLRVGMSVPTVLIGLLCYALFTREGGLLGSLGLLYTQVAIIFGEFLLALPLLGALTHGLTASLDRVVSESALTLGATRLQALLTALKESRPALLGALLAAFCRCLTELGIVMTVGGNIALQTRTLPSTIQRELSKGDFERALAAGMILLVVALSATLVAHWAGTDRAEP